MSQPACVGFFINARVSGFLVQFPYVFPCVKVVLTIGEKCTDVFLYDCATLPVKVHVVPEMQG